MASEKIANPRKPSNTVTFRKETYEHLYNNAVLMHNDYSATLVIRGAVNLAASSATILLTLPQNVRPLNVIYSDFFDEQERHYRFSILPNTGDFSIYNYSNEEVTNSNLIYTLSWTI